MTKLFLYSFILILLLCSVTQSQSIRGADSTNSGSKMLNFFSYKITEMPIEDALLYIANKSNVSVAFSKDIFPTNKKITLTIKNVSPKDALEEILKGTNTSIVALSGNKFVVKENISNSFTGSLRGIVTDSTNGEVLAFANVYIEGTKSGASTNTKGLFIITALPPGNYTIIVSYIGYQSKKLKAAIAPDKLTHVDFRLSPESIEIQTVEKIGERIAESNATDVGLQRISVKDLDKLPKGVETDIFRSLQYVPGVKSTGDVSSRFYVRGSPSNQNLILLNDIPVYHPYHALGMFSSVDPEMINSIEFYKGGFTSEYSERLSSVMRLITKNGNKYNISGKANLSSLTGKLLLDGPLPGGSFIMTARKSYNTKVLRKFIPAKDIPIDFYDLSFKFTNETILTGGRVSLFGYFSGDKLLNHNLNEADFIWKNKLIGFKWFQLSDNPLFYEINFYYSNFEGEVIPNASKSRAIKNSLDDISLQMDFKYIYDSKDELDFGLKIKDFYSSLYIKNFLGVAKNISGPKGSNISAYVKYKYLRFDNLGMDVGSRINLTRISPGDAGNYYFEPRVSITYRPAAPIALKAAWGIYNQELVTLSDEDELINIFEPWFITPAYLKPASAIHYIVGIDFLLNSETSMEVEGYYKKLNNYATLNDEKYFETDHDLVQGQGKSYGLEYQFNYTPLPFRVNLGYSLSWAFKEANNKKYKPRYDSRHSLNISFEYNIGDGWYASVSWIYYNGLPFTQIQGYEDKLYLKDIINTYSLLTQYKAFTLYGDRNAARLPDYHRMDFSLSKNIDLNFVKLYLDFSIINVYDRKNIFYFEKNTGRRVNMLPFLPTASVKAEF